MKRGPLVLLLGLAAFASPGIVFATSMVAINLAETVEGAEKAFVGRTTSTSLLQTEDGWAEEITMEVLQPVFGDVATSQTVTWKQYRIDESSRLPGMPEFDKGDEYLIFLSTKGQGTEYQAPFALGQGAFRVHRDLGTGKHYVRNEFHNAYLFKDLDAEAVAGEIVGKRADAKELTDRQKAEAVKQHTQKLLSSRFGAADLEVLVEAASALKSTKDASVKFRREPAPDEDEAMIIKGHGN